MCNVKFWRVRGTIVATETQQTFLSIIARVDVTLNNVKVFPVTRKCNNGCLGTVARAAKYFALLLKISVKY
jgi:hypothetical protein